MAISRARKEALVAEYDQQLEESQGLIFAHYRALTVPQLEDLRRQSRERDGAVYVVKNTLLRTALEMKGLEPPEDLLTGPTLVTFCHQDVPPLAALFRDFAKDVDIEDSFVLRGALLDQGFLSDTETLALADLPSRDVLFATVLSGINAPATQIAGVVASGIRQILNVVKAYVDKLEGGDAPAEAAA